MENLSLQSAGARTILARFKKDMAISLHKTVSAAIDASLEAIGTCYTEDPPAVLPDKSVRGSAD